MENFIIDPKNNQFTGITEDFVVTAKTYEDAAQKAARKLFGSKRGLRAIRTTGENGKSGIFNAYLPCKTGGQSSYGNNFHVMKCRS